jgi:hypothetical protein
MVDLPTYPSAKKLDKVRYEGRNILAAFSQRRQLDRKDIQAKVEVTAEFAISHHPRQIAMGGSYEPHIYLVSPAAAQAFEFLFLQYAQKFGLQRRRNIADFVEEKGTLIGQLEAAKLLRDGSGERTFFVAKKLAFQQIQWDGGAVQLDEWASVSRTDVMNCASDQLLASACFTLDQYSGARWCYSFDVVEDRFQRMAVANELFEFARARALIATITILGRPHGETCAHRVPSFST